jgi:hypothetical protein
MEKVILTTSSLALLGGLMIVFLVPNGPYRNKAKALICLLLIGVFRNQNYVLLLLDILAHVELYAFGHLR